MASTALRILGRADVLAAGGGDPRLALADVRAAFAALAAGRATMPAEISVPLGPADGGSAGARVYALPARLEDGMPVAGVKWTAHRPPCGDGLPSILGATIVNDALTGRPLGVVESAGLTVMRTAAVSMLALEVASPGQLRRIAVLGAGEQARGHLAFLASLRSSVAPGLSEVVLWNRTPARAEALAAAFATRLPIRPVPNIRAAIEGADAVLSCTAALSPILPEDAVASGRIVAQIGHHEAPFEGIARADTVVVDLWGPFAETSGKSLFRMFRAGQFKAEGVATDLGRALASGWRAKPGAAVYFSSFGLNVFDVALAARVLRRADELGIGTLVPLVEQDWDYAP